MKRGSSSNGHKSHKDAEQQNITRGKFFNLFLGFDLVVVLRRRHKRGVFRHMGRQFETFSLKVERFCT
jgi:hypothetical protein